MMFSDPIMGLHVHPLDPFAAVGRGYTSRRRSPIAKAAEMGAARSPPNHLVHQMIEYHIKVVALAGMYRRGLYDGASWGDQPMKSLAR